MLLSVGPLTDRHAVTHPSAPVLALRPHSREDRVGSGRSGRVAFWPTPIEALLDAHPCCTPCPLPARPVTCSILTSPPPQSSPATVRILQQRRIGEKRKEFNVLIRIHTPRPRSNTPCGVRRSRFPRIQSPNIDQCLGKRRKVHPPTHPSVRLSRRNAEGEFDGCKIRLSLFPPPRLAPSRPPFNVRRFGLGNSSTTRTSGCILPLYSCSCTSLRSPLTVGTFATPFPVAQLSYRCINLLAIPPPDRLVSVPRTSRVSRQAPPLCTCMHIHSSYSRPAVSASNVQPVSFVACIAPTPPSECPYPLLSPIQCTCDRYTQNAAWLRTTCGVNIPLWAGSSTAFELIKISFNIAYSHDSPPQLIHM